MVSVCFSNRLDAVLFQRAFSKSKTVLSVNEYDSHIQVGFYDGQDYDEITNAFMKVFKERKFLGWIEGVLKYTYHYNDEHEIRRVMEIAQEFERTPPVGVEIPSLFSSLHFYIKKFIKDFKDLDFDTLSVSVLKAIHSTLVDYTGHLLDEYKLEECHQLLVDTWRQRIHKRDTGVQVLHLKDESGFRYYHDEGNELREAETSVYMKQYPDPSILELPLDWDITPALVHAPQLLVIYSDRQGVAKLELLMSIFEEKAMWKRLSDFPF